MCVFALTSLKRGENGCTIISMKIAIWIGITVGGTLGSWLGAAMTHGNWMSAWSILLGAVGSIAGIWAGYKIGKEYM